MSFAVELSAEAEADVKAAYAYIRQHGPANPDLWKAGLDRKLESLEQIPESCGFAPEHEYSHLPIRQLLYGPFRILFLIRDSKVHVITVRHGARRFMSRDELNGL